MQHNTTARIASRLISFLSLSEARMTFLASMPSTPHIPESRDHHARPLCRHRVLLSPVGSGTQRETITSLGTSCTYFAGLTEKEIHPIDECNFIIELLGQCIMYTLLVLPQS